MKDHLFRKVSRTGNKCTCMSHTKLPLIRDHLSPVPKDGLSKKVLLYMYKDSPKTLGARVSCKTGTGLGAWAKGMQDRHRARRA